MVCNKCGAQLEDGVQKCTACGEEVKAAAAQQTVVNNTDDAEQNKVISLFAYIGILWLIPLLAGKDSKYARFHANQGLLLFICEAAWSIVVSILSAIFYAINFWVGSIVSSILGLASVVFLVFAILGIVAAVNKQEKELPIIGKFRILK